MYFCESLLVSNYEVKKKAIRYMAYNVVERRYYDFTTKQETHGPYCSQEKQFLSILKLIG